MTTIINSNLIQAGATTQQCYQGRGKSKDTLCIDDASELADGVSSCSATLNGEICNSCSYASSHSCFDFDSNMFTDGFHVDCSNIRESAVHLSACGSKFGQEKAQKPPKPAPQPQQPPSNTTTARHHSSNTDTLIAILPLLLFGLLAFFVGGLKSRRFSRRRRGEEEEAMEMVPMVFTSSQQQRSSPAVATAPNEALKDGKFQFEYFDASESDVIGSALIAYSMNNEWEKVKHNLERIQKAGTCTTEERAFYFKTIAQGISKTWPDNLERDIRFSPLLDNWKSQEPENADCRILRAETYLSWAWHARSSAAGASHSSCKQFNLFISRLKMCAHELAVARDIRPEDPLIYSIGISLVKGLGQWDESVMSVEDCLSRLQGIAAEPQLFDAHVAALQNYCDKWHGSHGEMFAYARAVTSELPAGHPLWVLIPMAHFERQLIDRPRDYWKQPEVVDEIQNAYQNAFPDYEAETCVTSSRAYEKRMEWTCRNYFAYALANCNLQELARRQIRVIGKQPMEGNPWGSLLAYKRHLRALDFDVDGPSSHPARGASSDIV